MKAAKTAPACPFVGSAATLFSVWVHGVDVYFKCFDANQTVARARSHTKSMRLCI